MGLDANFYSGKPNYAEDEVDFPWGENETNLIYFRKFYVLDTFMHNNFDKVEINYTTAYRLELSDLKKILEEAKSSTDGSWNDEWHKENTAKLIKFLEEEIVSPSSETYYYTYIN